MFKRNKQVGVTLTTFILLACIGLVQHAFAQQPTFVSKDYTALFERHGVTGCFVLHEINSAKYTVYNDSLIHQGATPASTFKIVNSLIALQTGVARNETFALKWDSVDRRNPNWNKDQTMREAFGNSTVWFYQEIARRVGKEEMKKRLDQLQYGNADTSGGIDKFWLSGGLRVSPIEQIDFLSRLYTRALVRDGFALEHIETVKAMMLREDAKTHKLYGKTGWGIQDGANIGWFVGFVESNGKAYAFATCVRTDDDEDHNFARSRIDITKAILVDLGFIDN